LKVCPACQTPYSDREKFCRRDGTRLVNQPSTSGETSVPQASLRIQFSNGQIREYTIDRQTLTIGAEADNTIVLNDTAVSRHHAQIRWHNGRYIIADNNSTNGVLVNQSRIGTGEFPLQTGDTITIGRTTLTFIHHLTQQSPSQPPVLYPPSHPPFQSPSQPPVQPAPQPKYQVPTPLPRPAVPPPQPPPQTARPVASNPPVVSQPPVKPPTSASKRVLDGRYELEALLGQDGLGTLYRARRLALGDQVAV
jgi:hypothetical protein